MDKIGLYRVGPLCDWGEMTPGHQLAAYYAWQKVGQHTPVTRNEVCMKPGMLQSRSCKDGRTRRDGGWRLPAD
jgi:hypothetical protein